MRSRSGRSGGSTFSAADERDTILRAWNDTARAVPPATLPELFAAQVARTPEAVAVVFEDQRLTYGELDARANQLAHHLRALGVGPEVVVGLCVERSPEMVVGLLGILKAGGAYLPLDPDYPRERLAFMLADAGAPVLRHPVGAARSAARARAPASCASMPTGRRSPRSPSPRPPSALDPHNTAYVIYTSGSTGTPKGVVVVTMAALSNITAGVRRRVEHRHRTTGCCQLRLIGFDHLGIRDCCCRCLRRSAGSSLRTRAVRDRRPLMRRCAQDGAITVHADAVAAGSADAEAALAMLADLAAMLVRRRGA